MSLLLRISSEETQRGILVNELTGDYSSENTGGYGVKNISKSDVTKAYLNITFDKKVYYIDLKPFGFPSSDNCFFFEVLPDMVGSKGCVKSGKYVIEYVIEGVDSNNQPFKNIAKFVLLATKCVEKCVDKLTLTTANVPVDKFMKDDKKKTAIEMQVLLEDVCWAKDCNQIDYADSIIRYIYSKGCSC